MEPGRDLHALIDLSRLGEFETCKAVLNLMTGEYLAAHQPDEVLGAGARGLAIIRRLKLPLVLGRVAGYAALLGLAILLARNLEWSWDGGGWRGTLRWEPKTAQRYASVSQIRVLRRALEVYRMEVGSYPPTLDGLVERGILRERDLHFPFGRRYFYKLEGGRTVLLPPVN